MPALAAKLAAARLDVAIAVANPVAQLLRAHLDNERLVDLVLTISFYCAVVRVLASLEIRVEPD